MRTIKGSICTVKGVTANGIKQGKNGLAIMEVKPKKLATAGVFTRNKVIAAPLIITKVAIETGDILAIIANSGCANAFTGEKGISDAKWMAEITSKKLNIKPFEVGVASTGVIGRSLDRKWIESHLDEVADRMSDSEESAGAAARAIMTTDLAVKEIAVELDNGVHIGGIAKGSGMIEPNMGTMLAFIFTDAVISKEKLDMCLRKAVGRSFNMVVVDGDTSTNDMALLTATGYHECGEEKFQEGLDHVCISLAKMIAKDGEGASRLIEARVTGARSIQDAQLAAKAIVRSPLVKTAIFGKDPNWGRVIAAAGYSGADIDQNKLSLKIMDNKNTAMLVDSGKIIEGKLDTLRSIMESKEIIIELDIGLGDHSAAAWGCDLTYDYVKINAMYTT